MKNTLVTTIARNVRHWTEAEAYRKDYNPDDLEGWCGIAAAELHGRLKKERITAKICVSIDAYQGCHCFLLVEDHVVDVTATQFHAFKDKKIVIMHSKEAEVHEIYRVEKMFGSAKELRVYQKKAKWPARQIAYA